MKFHLLQRLLRYGTRNDAPPRDANRTEEEDREPGEAVLCVRCQRLITVDPALSADVFEGMHWLCFHLEYEHDTDPDTPCRDFTTCPWWKIKYLEDRLRELGVDPAEVISDAIRSRVG